MLEQFQITTGDKDWGAQLTCTVTFPFSSENTSTLGYCTSKKLIMTTLLKHGGLDDETKGFSYFNNLKETHPM